MYIASVEPSQPGWTSSSVSVVPILGTTDVSSDAKTVNPQSTIRGQLSGFSSSSLPDFLISLQSFSSASPVLCHTTRFSFGLPLLETICLEKWSFIFVGGHLRLRKLCGSAVYIDESFTHVFTVKEKKFQAFDSVSEFGLPNNSIEISKICNVFF